MRDGVVLRADVYRPPGEGQAPGAAAAHAVLQESRAAAQLLPSPGRAGFVVVVQDTRGRYMSDGVAVPHDEGADGYDTVEWVATLPYVDGRVGMFGGSYSATTQLLAAPMRPPHLVALFPSASYASRYDMVFQGGAFYLGDGLSWNLGQAKDARRRALEPHGRPRPRDRPDARRAQAARRRRGTGSCRSTRWRRSQLRRYSPGYFDLLAHPSYDRVLGRLRRRREAPDSSRCRPIT